MKILVTGANGQLGRALQQPLPQLLSEKNLFFFGHAEMDITNPEMVEQKIKLVSPDVVIHCAAWTDVDDCESNPEKAYAVNTYGTENVVRAMQKFIPNATIVHISSEYVFRGISPFESWTEEDTPNPESVYGISKWEGEKFASGVPKHYIIRTSWLFGSGKNFVRTMLGLAKKLDKIPVIADQVGRPTYTVDLALAICQLIQSAPPFGVYNIANSGNPVSWFCFARNIFKQSGVDVGVIPILTEDWIKMNEGKEIAPRPNVSTLDLSKIERLEIEMPDWHYGLKRYLKTLEKVGDKV